MTKPDMIRFPGVQPRPGTRVWQFALKAPADLRQHFPGPWAVRCSLGTSDLRAANDKAKTLAGLLVLLMLFSVVCGDD